MLVTGSRFQNKSELLRKVKDRTFAMVLIFLSVMTTCFLVSCTKRTVWLQGAVLEKNADSRKQSPIPGVVVTAIQGSTERVVQTDDSGFFRINMGKWIPTPTIQPIQMQFRHPGYDLLTVTLNTPDQLVVVGLTSSAPVVEPDPKRPMTSVSNVRVRYSMKSSGAVSVGSAVKTFDVMNKGNVPCKGQMPCSPDGQWKATIGSATLDSGEGNEFRNVRISCIAGPCPFSRVDTDRNARGGNRVTVSVLNWSDPVTYLVEAEVYRTTESDIVQDSYPVIFGHTMNFSVPVTGQGVSIQADINGEHIVFPLGPSLCLSWANCTLTTDKDGSRTYRCELKDGFNFQ